MFIANLPNETLNRPTLYGISPQGSTRREFFTAIKSFSILVFYLGLLAAIPMRWWLLARELVC